MWLSLDKPHCHAYPVHLSEPHVNSTEDKDDKVSLLSTLLFVRRLSGDIPKYLDNCFEMTVWKPGFGHAVIA
jgi:hypothetical protein